MSVTPSDMQYVRCFTYLKSVMNSGLPLLIFSVTCLNLFTLYLRVSDSKRVQEVVMSSLRNYCLSSIRVCSKLRCFKDLEPLSGARLSLKREQH